MVSIVVSMQTGFLPSWTPSPPGRSRRMSGFSGNLPDLRP